MKIYVIRHGLTRLNKEKRINGQIDEPLAPEGVEQARAAIALVPKTVKRIYASTLSRTRQTADIINAELKLPITYHDHIREVNFGSLAGRGWSEMKDGKSLKEQYRGMTFDYRPEGESVEDVKARLRAFLGDILGKHADHEALLVAHGGIIRTLTLLEHGKVLDEVENVSIHSFDLKKILEK